MSEAVRVVVVDDEPHIRRVLQVLMTRGGYEVAVASDGEDGLERVEELAPQLVLLDANMPRMDGYELARRIKGGESGDGRPHVIMLTASGHLADAEHARDAGVDEFMTKPFNPTELLGRVREILEGR